MLIMVDFVFSFILFINLILIFGIENNDRLKLRYIEIMILGCYKLLNKKIFV